MVIEKFFQNSSTGTAGFGFKIAIGILPMLGDRRMSISRMFAESTGWYRVAVKFSTDWIRSDHTGNQFRWIRLWRTVAFHKPRYGNTP